MAVWPGNTRKETVLQLLWAGLVCYAQAVGTRYLISRNPLFDANPQIGAAIYSQLSRTYLAPPEWRTRPLPAYACPPHSLDIQEMEVPRLLRALLSLGARICGPPASNMEFNTTDFLTFLDLRTLPPDATRNLGILQ